MQLHTAHLMLRTIKVVNGMRAILIVLITLAVTACGDNNSAGNKSSTSTEKNVAASNTKLDLQNLPATGNVMLDLDPSVEDGFDAFGTFSNDGEVITIGISDQVAKAGGIDVNEPFQGNVTITIPGEHPLSRELYRVYSVSKVEKQ